MPAQLCLSPSLETSLQAMAARIQAERRSRPLLPVYVLTPTAHTVQAVRQRLGTVIGAYVYQFYGLGEVILDAAGQPVRWLDRTTLQRLVHHLLAQMQAGGEVSSFAAVWDKPGFNQTLVDWLREMKTQGIPPEDYAALMGAFGLERDRQLAGLYTQYQAFLQTADLSDADGLLWLAAERLEQDQAAFNRPGAFYVLGFDQFDPIQRRLLQALASRFAEFIIYLAWDESRPETSLALARVAETRRVLQKLLPGLVESRLEELAPAAPALKQLCRALFETEAALALPDVKTTVQAWAAPSREVEARLALRKIKRLLLQGVSPDEIALLAPHPHQYQRMVELAAEEYGIPIRLEEGLAANPAVQALLNLVSLAPDFPWRETLKALRSPYCRQAWLTTEQVDEIERLSRERPVIKGRTEWDFALASRPPASGEGLPADPEDLAEEEDAPNHADPASRSPGELSALRAGLTAFFDHLTPPEAASYREYTLWLQERILGLQQPGEDEDEETYPRPATLDLASCALDGPYAERDRQALACVLAALRALVEAEALLTPGDGGKISWFAYSQDIRCLLPGLSIPPDPLARGVRFDRLEAGREQPVDYLFLLGLSEGEFPSPPEPDPLYGLDERLHAPVPLRQPLPGEDAAMFWLVLNNCRRGLFLFRPRLDENGAPWQPSPFWEAVLEKAPVEVVEVPVAFTPALSDAAGPAELLVALARGSAQQTPPELASAWQAAKHTLRVMALRSSPEPAPEFEGRLPAADLQAGLAERFNSAAAWSVSRLNAYGRCPFLFFAQFVLELEERADPQEGMDGMARGSLLHAVLEGLHRCLGAEGLALTPELEDGVLDQLDAVCAELFPGAPERYGFRPSALWRYEQQELRRLLRAEVSWECSLASPYRPYQQELRFGLPHSDLPAYRLQDGQGTDFNLHGVIDRVDRDVGPSSLRVLDYKSGSAPISGQDIQSGRALQAPLYALAAEGLLGERVVECAYLLIAEREFSGDLQSPAGAHANADIQAALDQAGSFVRAIRAGEFPSLPSKPADASGACASNCAFGSLCRVDRQAVAKARRAAG